MDWQQQNFIVETMCVAEITPIVNAIEQTRRSDRIAVDARLTRALSQSQRCANVGEFVTRTSRVVASAGYWL